jgi:hypothetical protein
LLTVTPSLFLAGVTHAEPKVEKEEEVGEEEEEEKICCNRN